MITKSFTLIFALFSTPDGTEFADGHYFVLERCITAAHCSKKAKAYREAWPEISEFGTYLTLQMEYEEVI